MGKLFLHIGHLKTGSSYLQSCLALNADQLRYNGLNYVVSRAARQAAEKGMISSGNFEAFSLARLDVGQSYLFSSELFFDRLLSKDYRALRDIKRTFPELTVVMWTRNIFPYLYSEWGQYVKRHGLSASFEEHLLVDESANYSRVLDRINASKALPFRLILRNYSYISKNILEAFLQDLSMLQSDLSSFKLPSIVSVNRSLSFAELEIMRLLNQFLRFNSSVISDKLVEAASKSCHYLPRIDESTYEHVLKCYENQAKLINVHLPASEKLIFDEERFMCDGICQVEPLSRQQIDIISNELRFLLGSEGYTYSLRKRLKNHARWIWSLMS